VRGGGFAHQFTSKTEKSCFCKHSNSESSGIWNHLVEFLWVREMMAWSMLASACGVAARTHTARGELFGLRKLAVVDGLLRSSRNRLGFSVSFEHLSYLSSIACNAIVGAWFGKRS
jgi:hypothetical protein